MMLMLRGLRVEFRRIMGPSLRDTAFGRGASSRNLGPFLSQSSVQYYVQRKVISCSIHCQNERSASYLVVDESKYPSCMHVSAGGGQPLIRTLRKNVSQCVCNWTNQIACFGILQKSDQSDSYIWHLRPEFQSEFHQYAGSSHASSVLLCGLVCFFTSFHW